MILVSQPRAEYKLAVLSHIWLLGTCMKFRPSKLLLVVLLTVAPPASAQNSDAIRAEIERHVIEPFVLQSAKKALANNPELAKSTDVASFAAFFLAMEAESLEQMRITVHAAIIAMDQPTTLKRRQAVYAQLLQSALEGSAAQAIGLNVSLRDAQNALQELGIDVELEPLTWDDHETRWMGISGAVVVELWGTRDNLTKIAVTAGFAKNDLLANAQSLSALMSVITIALPFEDRRPVALWFMDEVGKIEKLPDDRDLEATHTAKDKQFELTFWKVLGMANLSVALKDAD